MNECKGLVSRKRVSSIEVCNLDINPCFGVSEGFTKLCFEMILEGQFKGSFSK